MSTAESIIEEKVVCPLCKVESKAYILYTNTSPFESHSICRACFGDMNTAEKFVAFEVDNLNQKKDL